MSWTKQETRRSYQCDGQHLREIRKSRKWSQLEFARHAGYSERLISKAEAGGHLTAAALEVFAQTLTTESSPVFPEDLIVSPEALARSLHYAIHHLQTEMFKRVEHFIDPSVVFHIHGDLSEVPFAGIYRGMDGFQNAIEIFFRTMIVPEDEVADSYEYFTDGDEVVVLGNTMIHPVDRPRKEPKPISQLMKFRDGKLFHFEDRYDIGATDQVKRNANRNDAS